MIDIASVLWRCGHSCARPEPSVCGGRSGSASDERRQHLARVELLDRVAPVAAHVGDHAGGLGEMRRARDVGDDAAGLAGAPIAGGEQLALQLRSARARRPATCASAPPAAGAARRGPVHGASTRMRSYVSGGSAARRGRPAPTPATSSGTPAMRLADQSGARGRDLVRLESGAVRAAPRRRAPRSCRRARRRGRASAPPSRPAVRAVSASAASCEPSSCTRRRPPDPRIVAVGVAAARGGTRTGEYGVRRASSGHLREPGQRRHRHPG